MTASWRPCWVNHPSRHPFIFWATYLRALTRRTSIIQLTRTLGKWVICDESEGYFPEASGDFGDNEGQELVRERPPRPRRRQLLRGQDWIGLITKTRDERQSFVKFKVQLNSQRQFVHSYGIK
ncbi:hypothetical protein J6590_016645 [Homalodisca vitripennis]|nr:hypothetical protein J6590_016645 [Homalodisca vitripennis]